jgi:hypothetical protein
VGRVWPRHGHRGRPLNSVVMRHARNAIAAVGICAATMGSALACTCVIWDPKYIAAEYSVIALAEIVAIDESHSETVKWHSQPRKGVPFTIKVIEALKGIVPSRQLYQVGYGYACEPNLKVGERRILLLWKLDEPVVSLCNVAQPSDSNLEGLRAALKEKQ